jgi:hypothetical protein
VAVPQATQQFVTFKGRVDLLVCRDSGQCRVASREGLTRKQDIWDDLAVVHTKHQSGAPESGHHLVGYEQDAMGVGEAAQFDDVFGWKDDSPSDAQHWFEKDGSEGRGVRSLQL